MSVTFSILLLFFWVKIRKIQWQLGLCPDPTGKVSVLPRPLADFRGSEERIEGKGRGGKGRGKGRVRERPHQVW